MPLSGDAKREYNKLRQRKLRLAASRKRESEGEGGQQSGQQALLKRDVVPGEHFPNPYESKSSQRALGYAAAVNASGSILVEAVDREGTFYWTTRRSPLLDRLEVVEVELQETQAKVVALEKGYVQHQAEHIIHDAPRVYADYLEEEGEEP